jgi:tRNA-dihydrouridine synthase
VLEMIFSRDAAAVKRRLLDRTQRDYTRQQAVVDEILKDVRENGDTALFAYTEQFDRFTVTGETLMVTELFAAASLVAKTKAAFIKTNTGIHGKPTTADQVCIIRDAVGDALPIKASGGIRTIDDMLAMIEAGASVFGIGAKSVCSIFEEIDRSLGRPHPEELPS